MGVLATLAVISGGAQAIGSAVGGVMDYKYSRDRIRELMARRYGTTEEGEYLKRVGREGVFSEREEATMASKVSRATAQSAQSAIDRYRASAAMQGTTGSISNERMIKDIELGRSGQIADVISDIGLSEAQSKERALSEYASRSTKYEQGREDEMSRLKYEGNRALVSGITGAVTAGISAASQGVTLSKQETAEKLAIEDKSNVTAEMTKYKDALRDIGSATTIEIDGQLYTREQLQTLYKQSFDYAMALRSSGVKKDV